MRDPRRTCQGLRQQAEAGDATNDGVDPIDAKRSLDRHARGAFVSADVDQDELILVLGPPQVVFRHLDRLEKRVAEDGVGPRSRDDDADLDDTAHGRSPTVPIYEHEGGNQPRGGQEGTRPRPGSGQDGTRPLRLEELVGVVRDE